MSDQGTFVFDAPPTDVIVDTVPDQYGFYCARPTVLGTRTPIVTGSCARTPQEAERCLRHMLASVAAHEESEEAE